MVEASAHGWVHGPPGEGRRAMYAWTCRMEGRLELDRTDKSGCTYADEEKGIGGRHSVSAGSSGARNEERREHWSTLPEALNLICEIS